MQICEDNKKTPAMLTPKAGLLDEKDVGKGHHLDRRDGEG